MADTKKYNTHIHGTSCLRLLKPAAKIKFHKNQEVAIGQKNKTCL